MKDETKQLALFELQAFSIKQMDFSYHESMVKMVADGKARGIYPRNKSNPFDFEVLMGRQAIDWQAVRDSIKRQIEELRKHG